MSALNLCSSSPHKVLVELEHMFVVLVQDPPVFQGESAHLLPHK